MKRRARQFVLIPVLLAAASCFTTIHTVGGGPTGTEVVSARQWYWAFGLFRLPPVVDSENLAGNATSYRVTTSWTLLDILMNVVTSVVTVQSRTIEVEK